MSSLIDRLIKQRRWLLAALFITTTIGLIVPLAGEQVIASSSSLADLAPIEIEAALRSQTFSQPVHLTHAGEGTIRLLVVEKARQIFVFENNRETEAANVFLDIQDRVNSIGCEEGLLGLAFDPQLQ